MCAIDSENAKTYFVVFEDKKQNTWIKEGRLERYYG